MFSKADISHDKEEKLQDYWASQQSKLAALQIFFGSLSIFSVRGRRLNYHTKARPDFKRQNIILTHKRFHRGSCKGFCKQWKCEHTLHTLTSFSVWCCNLTLLSRWKLPPTLMFSFREKHLSETLLSHIVFFLCYFFHLILVDVYSFMYRHLLVTICMFYLNRKKQKRNIMIRLDLKNDFNLCSLVGGKDLKY